MGLYAANALEDQELLKILILSLLFGLGAPLLGFSLFLVPQAGKWVFGVMCFMTMGGLFAPEEWGLTLDFQEYRGHATGYHFYFAEVLALGLILGRAFENRRSTRWLPPGLWLWFLYCGLSLLSLVNAPAPDLALKAAFKMTKMAVFFLAAYHFIRSEDNLHFFLGCMAAAMFWQLYVVLKMKYWDGIYQVAGTFEHQNSLSMYVNLIAMVLLAAALGPRHRFSPWYMAAFIACAVIQQSALSRGGLVVFGAATAGVVLFSLADGWSRRRIAVTALVGCVGLAGLVKGWDTIVERFQEHANEAGTATRGMLKQASLFMVKDHPLGVGWNNYGLVINHPFPYGDHIVQWEREGGVRPDLTHQKGIEESLYYLLLAETGYQSLAAFLLLVLVFGWRNLRAMWAYRGTFIASVSLGILMGCTSNYVHSILERVFTQPRNLMLWMLLLGVTARIETWRRERRDQAEAAQESSPEETAHARLPVLERTPARPAAARSSFTLPF